MKVAEGCHDPPLLPIHSRMASTKPFVVTGTNGTTATGGMIIVTPSSLLPPDIISWTGAIGIQLLVTIPLIVITTMTGQSTPTAICFRTK